MYSYVANIVFYSVDLRIPDRSARPLDDFSKLANCFALAALVGHGLPGSVGTEGGIYTLSSGRC